MEIDEILKQIMNETDIGNIYELAMQAYNSLPTNDQPVDCREAFEKWSKQMPLPDGNYFGYYQSAWEAWIHAWNACPEREAVTQWQPMDTAPKDGTTILAICEGENGPFIIAVWWQANVWYTGWVSGGHRSDYEDRHVTQWMPLPEIPRRGSDD
jgi:hypothetical protein